MFKQQRGFIGWKWLAVFGASVLLLGELPLAQAAKTTERSRQKQIAEAERANLQQKLTALKRSINHTETAKNHAADALALSEATISEADRALHELTVEQQQTEMRLNQLTAEQSGLTTKVMLQQKQLAKLLREQYVAGNEDRTRLLLSGDNPSRINRELQYMGYVSKAQARLIDTLRINLQAVDSNRTETQNTRDELDEIAREALEQKAILEKEQARRTALLSQLSDQLVAQRKEAGNLQHDEQRLAGLLDKLSKLIEEHQRAEAAAQEKRRQDLLRARDKLRAQQARSRSSSGKIINPDAIDSDEAPGKSLARNELSPAPDIKDGLFPQTFSSLRGQLRLPLRGELVAKFGSKRGDGPNWKGVFIRAAEGSEVKAVASGRVVFAEWLRGFGNLIILDHGGQYLTIYGNNQSVLKRAGDAVKTGEVIASAGNSGGNEQSGLYFEIRHQGRAFDPLAWMQH